ncbi:hemin-degrading factor [Coralliovum pocilloporae]|uniref:hemin-degrading factor n=1 Tax=Coralliovum pocilloporae TaxID=3066369 RepID=UPI0033073D52
MDQLVLDRIDRVISENPKLRPRDLAQKADVSEAHLLARRCGKDVIRLTPDHAALLSGFEALGEIMALTRNESVVHEKIGHYGNIRQAGRTALVLNGAIDLRIFLFNWIHVFAVEDVLKDSIRHSIQIFDASGEAVHKIYLRPSSSQEAYHSLIRQLKSDDQSVSLETDEVRDFVSDTVDDADVDIDALRQRWQGMTDVHQFFSLLKSFKVSRHQAHSLIGEDFAWRLDKDAATAAVAVASDMEIPIMCFVGNRGCVQIHSGPVFKLKRVGPWFNILDPEFNLHLREDHIHEVWAIRKPNKYGHVTSIELFDEDRNLITQFFGVRDEDADENPDWRSLIDNLPKHF